MTCLASPGALLGCLGIFILWLVCLVVCLVGLVIVLTATGVPGGHRAPRSAAGPVTTPAAPAVRLWRKEDPMTCPAYNLPTASTNVGGWSVEA